MHIFTSTCEFYLSWLLLPLKVYVREPAPFVSMAEMMKKFQSSTRDLSLPQSFQSHVINRNCFFFFFYFLKLLCSLSSITKFLPINQADATFAQMKPTLKLTRPKEPEFETAQRMRSIRVKSTAELEEEMMAKVPKFKARPFNKKVSNAYTILVYGYFRWLIVLYCLRFFPINLLFNLFSLFLFGADFWSSSTTCSTKKYSQASRISSKDIEVVWDEMKKPCLSSD